MFIFDPSFMIKTTVMIFALHLLVQVPGAVWKLALTSMVAVLAGMPEPAEVVRAIVVGCIVCAPSIAIQLFG